MFDIDSLLAQKKVEVAIKLRENPLKNFVENLEQSKMDFKNIIKEKNNSINKIIEYKNQEDTGDCEGIYMDIDNLKSFDNKKNKPILLQELIIDEYQIFEARLLGADAIVIIKNLFSNEEINHFVLMAKVLKMDVVLEVNTIEEMYDAVLTDTDIISINNWDDKTKTYDLRKTLIFDRLNKQNKTIISNGGLNSLEKIKLVSAACNAIIV